MKYRPEIDGLRAVAVLPVILFHAGFSLFSGGFVGVDVFFVISGFLITTIIVREMEKGAFSLSYFYERRIRRIFPALFLVIACSIPFAVLTLVPDDMRSFSGSVIAAASFWSNIFFWLQTGYFDQQAELKPLLHTWSLAVEEQYYIFFPPVLMVLWRWGLHAIIYFLAFVFVASLAVAQWGSYYQPAATFFLLPTRGWELLVGAFAALYLHKKPFPQNRVLQETGSLLGLGLILYSIFAFDKGTPFPGLWALIPTVGTALIILFSGPQTLTYRLLSLKGFVLIGLISYSAYLWHQPLFAFTRHYLPTEPSHTLMLALSAVTLPLSYLSWKYVETPFRDKHKFTRKHIFTLATIVAVAACLFGAFGIMKNGNLYRYSEEDMKIFGSQEAYNEYVWAFKDERDEQPFTDSGALKILVVGDSNSADLMNILHNIEGDFEFSSLRVNSGCGNLYLPRSRFEENIPPKERFKCLRGNNDDLTDKKHGNLFRDADVVFMATAWKDWEIDLLPESLEKLKAQYGDKFVAFGIKRIRYSPKELLRVAAEKRPDVRVDARHDNIAFNNRIAAIEGMRFVDPFSLFCEDFKCPVVNEDNMVLLYDGFHLTPAGAEYLSRNFPKKFLSLP